MAVVLATGGSWSREPGTGITYAQVLHAEQHFGIIRPFPAHGTVVSRSRVIDIVDKGHGRGAIVTAERLLFFNRSEEHTSELQSLMRISYAVFCLKKKKYQPYSSLILYQYKSVSIISTYLYFFYISITIHIYSLHLH